MPHSEIKTLKTSRREIALSGRPLVMGILNVTPDSFSDGGKYLDPSAALARAEEMIAHGADILDVGGESTRPGAASMDETEEQARVLPVIRELVRRCDTPLSIDTWKPETALRAAAEGVEIINDITGLRNPAMVEAVNDTGAAVVAMHMRGMPWFMQQLPPSPDILGDIRKAFESALLTGLPRERLVLDPGIGFGTTVEDNLLILSRLEEFRKFGCPLLVGVSRKSFIGAVTSAPVGDRLPGSLAASVLAVANGARIVRCHDVAETCQALEVAWAILSQGDV